MIILRVKHWAGFPHAAVRSCLSMAGVTPDQIDAFGISRNPRANWLRKALFVLRHRPRSAMVSDRARNLRRIGSIGDTLAASLGLDASRVRSRLHWVEHHPSHLASSFFVSPF